MASTLDLYIDTSSGKLVEGGSVVGGALPTLTRNDAYTLRLRLLEKKSNGSLDDIDFTGSSLKVGIGNIEEAPSSGSFKLSINGITSSAISYNSTAISIYNAISNNVSTVALYGSSEYGSYLLTATQPNTAMSFGSDPFTLFPTSSVLVSTRRNPASGIQAQQVVKLVRNPIVYADTFSTTPTAGELTLTKLQGGSNTANETYELAVGPLARGGSFALVFGPNSTTAIPLFQSAVSVQASISAGISTVTSNISVQENGKGGYIIGFTGRLGLTNITTSLTLDASGIQFIPMRQTTLTINTAEIADAFADSAASTITPTLEIELTQNGTPKTIYQDTVTIRKDLITVGSTVPGAQASYYTKSEANALFVEDSTSNIDQTNRTLYDVNACASFDYSNRTLLSNSGFDVVINTTTGLSHQSNLLGFYNSALTARPASTNVVSALVNLGLIASSVTLGGSSSVTDSTTNIDATGRTLRDATNNYKSVDYGQRILVSSLDRDTMSWGTGSVCIGTTYSYPGTNLVLKDTSSFTSISVGESYGSKIGTTTYQKIGFYNSTPVVQPSNTNAVSGLINLGLLASSTTYGVLPGSAETLAASATIDYGTLTANTSSASNVTVTGAATGDTVLIGLPSAISAGVIVQGVVFAANTVCMTAINATSASRTIGSATYRITVIGY
jgi:hypothetical protein